MDLQALNNLSYGMYIVTTRKERKNVGCLINSAMQITSKNPIIAISLNKENYTNEVLKETRECALSILSEKTNLEVISKFGFSSSSDTNKFENRNYKDIDNLPVVVEDICAYIIGEVIRVVDAETHDIFLIRVKQTEKVSEESPMTYKYYRERLKGKSPKKAPTYQEEKVENQAANRYQCSVCGYIYDDSKEEVKFEDLPENWTCPLCGVGKDKFIKL